MYFLSWCDLNATTIVTCGSDVNKFLDRESTNLSRLVNGGVLGDFS